MKSMQFHYCFEGYLPFFVCLPFLILILILINFFFFEIYLNLFKSLKDIIFDLFYFIYKLFIFVLYSIIFF